MEKQRGQFSNKIGFVLATAGSAVGLGNLWRFPYLAAKYGGGCFLLVYLILVVTFGYGMMVSESSIGRMTKKSPIGAFRRFGSSFFHKFGGWINAIVPMIIVPYYCVIGGWVVQYLIYYIQGKVYTLALPNSFSLFIGNPTALMIGFLIFSVLTIIVILGGVKNGVERVSKIVMPLLVVLAVVITIYSVTRPGAIEGVKYFLIPNFSNFSIMTVVSAMGQMFYSLSIAMGILITYGSYMGKDMDIEASTTQIEIFDTVIAILAGLMIIPAVFAFSGGDPNALKTGPSLMFVTLPKVFASMGFGRGIGILFFGLVLIAALTSSMSLLETCVSTVEDELGWSRKSAVGIMSLEIIGLGTLSCLGFNILSHVKLLGMQFLDFFDFLSNSIMMPIASICIAILVLRYITLKGMEEEITQSSKFKRRGIYNFVMKYLAIPFAIIIFLSSVLSVLGIISI